MARFFGINHSRKSIACLVVILALIAAFLFFYKPGQVSKWTAACGQDELIQTFKVSAAVFDRNGLQIGEGETVVGVQGPIDEKTMTQNYLNIRIDKNNVILAEIYPWKSRYKPIALAWYEDLPSYFSEYSKIAPWYEYLNISDNGTLSMRTITFIDFLQEGVVVETSYSPRTWQCGPLEGRPDQNFDTRRNLPGRYLSGSAFHTPITLCQKPGPMPQQRFTQNVMNFPTYASDIACDPRTVRIIFTQNKK